jgi:hypothetical protein
VEELFGPEWVKAVIQNVNRSPPTRARQAFTARILLEAETQNVLLSIFEGNIVRAARRASWTDSWDFAIRGTTGHWSSFLKREPLHNDIFACIRRDFLRLEGNSELAMMNVSALASLLEAMRGQRVG